MLLLQAQMALAGCLMKMPGTVPAAAVEMPADCQSANTELVRTCLRHCEQTSESPASSSDRSAWFAADLPLLIQRTIDEPYPAAVREAPPHRIDPPPANGPPVYLRLLRLLD